MASYVVRTVSGIDMPSNDGAFRPITLRLPEGSIVNPAFPAPVCNRGVTYHRIHDVMMGALFTAVPDRVTAAHNGCPVVATIAGHDDGENWVLGLVIQGGMGARWDQDGIDAITTEVSNLTNQPMESIEMSFPVRVHRRMVVPDSGGAGRFRGGLGQEIEVELLSGEASCSYLAERHSFLPWGVCGGQPAKSSRMTLMRHDGTVTRVEGNKVLSLSAGDRFVLRRPGGGGYGDPLERPAEDVAEDVRTSKVSETAAREDYGVVLDGTSVDEPSTARLRRELAAARGPVTWMFDRGPHGRDAGVPATTRLEEQA